MRGIDLFSFFRATRRVELFDGACDAVLTAAAEIEFTTPAVLTDGVALARLQGTGEITADTADFPCPSFEVVRTEVNPLRIGQTLRETLDADLAAEHDARTLYIEARDHCESVKDYVSKALFEELIADEEGHIDFLEMQIELYENLGAERYGLLNASAADEGES